MKFKYLIKLTLMFSFVGCFHSESGHKLPQEKVPDSFVSSCYWENHHSVRDACIEADDESCIVSHYLNVGEQTGLEFECSEVWWLELFKSINSFGGTEESELSWLEPVFLAILQYHLPEKKE